MYMNPTMTRSMVTLFLMDVIAMETLSTPYVKADSVLKVHQVQLPMFAFLVSFFSFC